MFLILWLRVFLIWIKYNFFFLIFFRSGCSWEHPDLYVAPPLITLHEKFIPSLDRVYSISGSRPENNIWGSGQTQRYCLYYISFERQEHLINYFSFPATKFLINQWRNPNLWEVDPNRRQNSIMIFMWKPMVLENPNRATISNPPFHAFLNSITPFKDGLPCKRASIFFGIKNRSLWEELWFEELPNRESSLVINLQTCLASNASLNFCNSLKPIPSSFFGLQSLLHLIQWTFLLSPRWPHQNFRTITLISWQREVGSLKQLIE